MHKVHSYLILNTTGVHTKLLYCFVLPSLFIGNYLQNRDLILTQRNFRHIECSNKKHESSSYWVLMPVSGCLESTFNIQGKHGIHLKIINLQSPQAKSIQISIM